LLVVAALLYVGVLIIGARVSHTGKPLGIDLDVYRALRSIRFLGRFVDLGSAPTVALLAVVLGVFALERRDAFGVVVCALAPAAAGALTQWVAKPVFGRSLPWHADVYPSGHVTGAAAMAVVAVVLAYRYGGRRVARAVAPIALSVPVVVAIAVTVRVYHYATDAVGGMAIGLATAIVVVVGADAVIAAGSPPPSPAPESPSRRLTP
jgi:membrane-associated phospholipid phosphatase